MPINNLLQEEFSNAHIGYDAEFMQVANSEVNDSLEPLSKEEYEYYENL